jgi:hypothetical protein
MIRSEGRHHRAVAPGNGGWQQLTFTKTLTRADDL